MIRTLIRDRRDQPLLDRETMTFKGGWSKYERSNRQWSVLPIQLGGAMTDTSQEFVRALMSLYPTHGPKDSYLGCEGDELKLIHWEKPAHCTVDLSSVACQPPPTAQWDVFIGYMGPTDWEKFRAVAFPAVGLGMAFATIVVAAPTMILAPTLAGVTGQISGGIVFTLIMGGGGMLGDVVVDQILATADSFLSAWKTVTDKMFVNW